jgi:hypothetical protein
MQQRKSHFAVSIAMAAAILLAAGTTAQAQSFSGGVKVGLNVADMYDLGISSTEIRPLFSGGAFLTYRPHELFAIQPELNFTMKGADVSPGVLGENRPASYDLGYFEVPLLFKTFIPVAHAMEPNLYIGPAVGFKLFGEEDGTDLGDQVESVEASLVVGGGLEVPFGRRSLLFDLRYTLGMTDVFYVEGSPGARTGTFGASIGIRF